MKLPSYLRLSRHGVFCYRQRVPRDIRPILNVAEIRCSLRTRDRRAAISRARQTVLRADAVFERLRTMPKKPADPNVMSTDLIVEITWGLTKVKLDYDPSSAAEREEADRRLRQFSEIADPSSIGAKSAPALVASTAAPLLGDLIELFLSDAEVARRGDRPATVRKDRDALRAFSEAVGSGTRADQISQTAAVKFAEALAARGLAVNTTNNQMGSISKFSKWICGRRPDVPHKALDFGVLRLKSDVRPDEERDAFDVEEVRRLLSAPETEAARKKAPHKFWMPWIAAYTGMRTEEIAQLNPQTDFVDAGTALWVIVVSDRDGKQLKNKTARRQIPVHHALVALGLREYVEDLRRAGSKTLFPRVKAYEGRLAKNAARPANRHIKSLGIDKTLHGLRHTVSNQLKQAGVDEMYAAALLGHGYGGISYSRYGKALPPDIVYREAVSKLRYGLAGEIAPD